MVWLPRPRRDVHPWGNPVPITSRSEFEAVVVQVAIKVDKALYERGQVPALEEARRTLEKVARCSKDPVQLKALRQTLDGATEAICAEIDGDPKLRDDLWDCLDYLDYRL